MTTILFLAGLAALFAGGNWLVRGAVALALRLGMPAFVVGATVVGFGTSMPELLVSLDAAFAGAPGVSIGNVLGSNIANILLILGVTAATGVVAASWSALRGDMIWMLAAALLTVPVFLDGQVSRLDGGLLLAVLAGYLYAALRQRGAVDPDLPAGDPAWRAALFLLVGLALLVLGARWLVDSATVMARAVGVSDAVIGLTVVAVGTSLPELAASVAAALRGQRDIALGNVVGSNVFNILAILGITAVIVPIPVAGRFVSIDMPLVIALSLALVALVAWRDRISRRSGFAFLAIYAAYIAAMAVT